MAYFRIRISRRQGPLDAWINDVSLDLGDDVNGQFSGGLRPS